MNEDAVEKVIELRASPARVWRAISSPEQFATWFGLGEPLELVGTFTPGGIVDGIWRVDGKPRRDRFCVVDRVEPERVLAFRWVPYELPEGADHDLHPMTRVELRLEPTEDGTRLTIVESGFSSLPADKQYTRDRNGRGWAVQSQAIAQHLLGKIEVRVEARIARPIAEVFEAIVDPARMARYFISQGSGRMETGGHVEWTWADVGATLGVDVIAVEAPSKVRFVWPATGVPTTVALALEPDGDHATKLVATETPFALTEDGARRAMQQTQGWTDFGCCLKAYLQHRIDLRRGAGVA